MSNFLKIVNGRAAGTAMVLGDLPAIANDTVLGNTSGGSASPSALSITGSGNVVFSSGPTLTNPVVGTQSSSDNSTKAASTAYVTAAISNAVSGINPAVAVSAATTSSSDTSGLTYNNGVSGIGATFTGTVNTPIVFDTVTFNTLGQRGLVKNDTQSPSGAYNGVYYVTQLQTGLLPPILTRALDYDQPSDINSTGAIPVTGGTLAGNLDTSWILTSTVNTVGTDPLTYVKFSINPSTILTNTLTSAHLFVGNGSNIATDTAVSGDLTLSNTGAFTIANSAVTNAKMANMANNTMKANISGGSAAPSDVSFVSTATASSGMQRDTNANSAINNLLQGYTTTATAAGTTTLTVASTYEQYFTGTTTQTVVLPVTSTLVLGQQFLIQNRSTGVVTIQSSGANSIQAMAANSQLLVTVILTSGTTAASWDAAYTVFGGSSGGSSAATFNNQSGTTYTFVLADGSANGNNPIVTGNNTGSQTYTIPPHSSVAFPVGSIITLVQLGTGMITVAPGSGVTLSSFNGGFTSAAQYIELSLLQVTTDNWVLFGDLSSPPALFDVLVVAGGGGGGDQGGGGGAGQIQSLTGSTATVKSYTVTVGGGGAGGGGTGLHGTAGSNSVFDTITATGGGFGGSGNQAPNTGGNGGSGGGGGDQGGVNAGGTGSTAGSGGATAFGNNGGSSGGGGVNNASGGGGGANAVGANGTSNTGGAGGAGKSFSISGSAVTYAGGGGGGARSGGTAGAGGAGGGGSGGANTTAGSNATANTGGGGGGSGTNGATSGGAGGSGIVIIRANANVIQATGGVKTTVGGSDIWTFTSSGTWQVTAI